MSSPERVVAAVQMVSNDKRPENLTAAERLIARGELEELEGEQQGQLAVRLTEVADLQEGLE
jgi:hypothetical protein